MSEPENSYISIKEAFELTIKMFKELQAKYDVALVSLEKMKLETDDLHAQLDKCQFTSYAAELTRENLRSHNLIEVFKLIAKDSYDRVDRGMAHKAIVEYHESKGGKEYGEIKAKG